ncbi:MAG: hypothetical protein JWO48_277 [Bryobacterales bacterium]|nr:hypothetical protein [Bryobacterales bacterium]
MKRSWNAFVWTGFGISLLAFLSYYFVFVRWPGTRDVPWANLLLFFVGGVFLGIGLNRAYRKPERYRGKISGAVLSVLSLLVFGFFCYFNFSLAKDLPSANAALHAGQQAPDFNLSDANGKPVTLSELLKNNRAVVLIFYRGYW